MWDAAWASAYASAPRWQLPSPLQLQLRLLLPWVLARPTHKDSLGN